MDRNAIYQTNSSYWDTNGNDTLGAIVLPLYGSFLSEERCHLLGDITGKKVLEIGCGNGRSLQYMGERGAAELWGIDLSEKQIEKAQLHLTALDRTARLICAPMEEECGLPTNYFDYVYSIYAIGWTTDLPATLSRIASYLKKDGTFIFSWSHPIHKCIVKEGDHFIFDKCYFDESWYTVPQDFCRGELSLSDRMLSTYINALVQAGFIIEQMVEQSDEDLLLSQGTDSDFVKRAKQFPVTFVIKARKQ